MNFRNTFISSIIFLFTSSGLLAQWSSLGNGTAYSISSLGDYNGKLLVGGTGLIGGIGHGLASWDGSAWDSVGCGTSYGEVKCFAVYNNELVIGGGFFQMGSNSFNVVPNTDGIAAWNGSQWHALGISGANNTVSALEVYNGELYAAGRFTTIGGVNCNRIARWDGTSWKSVSTGLTGGMPWVFTLRVFNGELYAGGMFYYAGGVPANGLARWNGIQWDSVGAGVAGWPFSMEVDTLHNNLIISGNFANYDTTMGIGICAWDGTKLLPIGTGLNSTSSSVAFYNNYLIATKPTPTQTPQDTIIAYWDSISWRPITTGNKIINALISYNNELYAGGFFDTIGGQAIPYIARYYNPSLGVPEPKLETKKLKIFPNPSAEAATISFSFADPGVSNLQLYNSSGKLVLSKKMKEATNTFKLDTGLFPKGIYFITVQNKKEKLTEKFVIE